MAAVDVCAKDEKPHVQVTLAVPRRKLEADGDVSSAVKSVLEDAAVEAPTNITPSMIHELGRCGNASDITL